MTNLKYVKYEDAINLIEEGDVLLFRGKTLTSWFVEQAGEGRYSHVGLATWHNGCIRRCGHDSLLEITEFREWKGGRTVDLATAYSRELKERTIDVYRVISPVHQIEYDPVTKEIVKKEIKFDGKKVTNHLRTLTGLPYGWRRIWRMFTHKMLGFRWFTNFTNVSDDDKIKTSKIYPVCSTAVAASYSQFGLDLVPNKADEWVEPSDLSRSSILNYLFTLTD